jgi:hypothetical protein
MAAKRYTVSLPDEVAEELEKWREELSISELFKRGVQAEIQRKQWLSNKVEDEAMEQTIERLREQKKSSMERWRDQGRKDALEVISNSTYEEIEYIATVYEPCGDFDHRSCFPTKDDVWGESFEVYMDESPQLKSGKVWEAWEEGFIEAMREVYEQI